MLNANDLLDTLIECGERGDYFHVNEVQLGKATENGDYIPTKGLECVTIDGIFDLEKAARTLNDRVKERLLNSLREDISGERA